MGPVHGITSLERDHLVPASCGDLRSDGRGGAEGARKVILEVAVVQHLDRAGDDMPPEAAKGPKPGVGIRPGF